MSPQLTKRKLSENSWEEFTYRRMGWITRVLSSKIIKPRESSYEIGKELEFPNLEKKTLGLVPVGADTATL